MPDSDNLAKLRRNMATQIEWALRTNQPAERLLNTTQDVHGGTKLTSVETASHSSELSKPRVLREVAAELMKLEKAADLSYLRIRERLKGRHAKTTVGRIFSARSLPGNWSKLQKSDVESALIAFGDCCTSLALPEGVGRSAKHVVEFLTSAAGRELSDLTALRDIDLTDWEFDHGVLRNVLRKLGNPGDWIQTWLDAGTPYNVAWEGYYRNFYSLLALRAVAATKRFRRNLWASRKQWERKGYRVVDGEKGAPVFHYFSAPEADEDRADRLAGDQRAQGPLRRVSIVFNASQVRRAADERPFRLNRLVEEREDVDECVTRHGAKVICRDVRYPFYDPDADVITMPPMTWFRARGKDDQATVDYYATLLHELVHWTGHESRLARVFGENDDANYQFEELVAELGSGFLCARFGLGNARRMTADRNGLVAYINYWFDEERDPVDLLLDAAGLANRASNYLLYEGDETA